MRILALVTEAFGGHGGIARYNQALIRAFADSEAVSEIVVLPRKGHVEPGSLPWKTTQLAPVASPATYSARAAQRALAGGTFDVVFCGHLHMSALAWIVVRIAGGRLWLQIHGIEAWHCPKRHLRAAAERTDLVTAVSRHTRRRFLEWAAIDQARVRVLPNTFEPGFAAGPKPRHLAQRLGLEGHKVILTVSRLAASERYKGHDRVIAALPQVLRRHPAARYLVAGTGDDLPRLRGLAEASGVAHAVVFIGNVPDHELPDYYRLADAFVMPSTGEGFGIVYLEAAATAVPVIAGDRDGSADALADGALGTLVDPDDTNEIAAAIVATLDRPPPQSSRGAARFAFANFSRHVDELVRSCVRLDPPPVAGPRFDEALSPGPGRAQARGAE